MNGRASNSSEDSPLPLLRYLLRPRLVESQLCAFDREEEAKHPVVALEIPFGQNKMQGPWPMAQRSWKT